jgi:hypothetical protein
LQATEAETKEDREIICEEVFCDITGQLDFVAKGQLLPGCAAVAVAEQLAAPDMWRCAAR